ncbi:MAG: hypothetical protein AAGC55_14960, partial [Myxococcota bacterium]
MRLSADILGDTDVVGMRYTLIPVDCSDGSELSDSDPITEDKELEDILLPGGIPEFEGGPFDSDSEHLFADLFLTVPAGCYDVATVPLRSDGSMSVDCASAMERRVEVVEGETTEVFLINQCTGEGPGAIDVISAINHAPELIKVEYIDSKFGLRCESGKICATVRDVDSDPLELDWRQVGDIERDMAGFRTTEEYLNDDGSRTVCVDFIPQEAGRYEFELTVYDLLHDGDGLIRIEDWLASAGYPNPSHASLSFPYYSAGAGARAPEDEICDGRDNDCDFEVDEGLEFGGEPAEVGGECTPAPGDPTIGECRAGALVCTDDGSLACDGYVGPSTDFCGNGLDEDCDGVDNVCPDGGLCPDGLELSCVNAIDLVLLEDLSGSFANDLPVVKALAPELHSRLVDANPDTRCGLASFIDKPIS